jgi:hypothetical protein
MKFGLCLLAFCPLVSFAAEKTTDAGLDHMMAQWIGIESQKGRLQSEWNIRKAELDRRISLLNIEQESLKDVLAQTNKSTSSVDQRRLSLLKAQDELENEQAFADAEAQKVKKLAESLLVRLPPPLQAQWQEKLPLLSQAGVSTSEKLERLLGIFKLVEDFDDRVALNRTTMEVPESSGQLQQLFVTQIYLGAGQGWYVNDDGSAYGYGRATKLGWKWWHGEQASVELGRKLDPQDLLRVRAELESPTTATFVSLPIKI